MSQYMLAFLLIFLATGVLFIALSVPLIRRKVRPNPLYGFRVRRTLNDPDVWYPANVYAAWRLLWLGVVVILAAFGGFFIPGLHAGAYVYALLAVLLFGLAVGMFQSFAYLDRLTQKDEEEPR